VERIKATSASVFRPSRLALSLELKSFSDINAGPKALAQS